MSRVSLRWVTPNPEFEIAYIARGSNPPNQDNPEYERLLRYCLRNGHWSPFQMSSLCVEFETSLAVANQVKRHWSMAICEPADIQETSMRYMDPLEHGWDFQPVQLRRQSANNRQSSEQLLTGPGVEAVNDVILEFFTTVKGLASELTRLGVAREVIRMLYPQAITTRFFLSGSCRSWIHYFQQRLDEHAQLEHRHLAWDTWCIFSEHFPVISRILQDTDPIIRSSLESYQHVAHLRYS